MSRRNPMNQRYQKDVTGKTRRSASSAKPKRAQGERTTDKPTKKTGIVEKGKKRESRKIFEPLETTAEMKRWRKIWWGYILGSLAFIGGSLVTRDVDFALGSFDLSAILVTMAYASIFTAIYIDFTKIRRLRKEALEAKNKGKKPKEGKKDADTQKGADKDAK